MNNLNLLLSRPIAHRGLHNSEIPENSITAIKAAFDNNYNCEIDVQITKDNEVVVFHDENLLRLCGINKPLQEFTFSELQNFSLRNSNQKIPLLKDVLRIIEKDRFLLIELKNMSLPGKLELEVKLLLDSVEGNIFLQSFNPFSVLWLKKNVNHIQIGLITSDFKNEKMNAFTKFMLTRKRLLKLINPDFLALDIKMNLEELKSYKKVYRNSILTWTVRSTELLEKAKLFADNIIFENIAPEEFERNNEY